MVYYISIYTTPIQLVTTLTFYTPHSYTCINRIVIYVILVSSFHINLSEGGELNEGAETALHFNPRFGDEEVVRNSFLKARWRKEERSSLIDFPFSQGEDFEVIFLVAAKSFKVLLFSRHYITLNLHDIVFCAGYKTIWSICFFSFT